MAPKLPNHDFTPGHLTACQICGSQNLELVMDLGHQPLCDSLLTDQQLNEPEASYPLRQFRCVDCSLNQIDYVVDSELVYHKEYPYKSGVTKELVEYQLTSSASTVSEFGLNPGDLVVDIGSNDGTLLKGFKAKGMRVLGIEPTNIAKLANEDQVETIQEFFTEDLAKNIVKEFGHAKCISATNVFAHMATLGEVIRGIQVLLEDGGIFVCEVHYLLEVIRGGQYDTIYHEHLRTYSLKSLITLLESYNFTVIDARQVNRYGGSLRVYAAKGKTHTARPSVGELLRAEEEYGLYDATVYQTFREKAERSRYELLNLAMEAKIKGLQLVGNSCPGRSSTLLNYCGIDHSLMPYICEQSESLKLGMYLPGMHIPIVDNKKLIEDQPDYVVLLAWHYAEPITQYLRERGLRSKLVLPLPELRILE